MPIILFYLGTVCLFAAAGLSWAAAEWCAAECFNGGPAMAFWLLLSGGLTVLACLFMVAFICNVIDIIALHMRETKAVRHDR